MFRKTGGTSGNEELQTTGSGGGGGGTVDQGAAGTDPWLVEISSDTTGLATAANQTAEQTLIGAVNETAPVTDTASSGLNGRLQRIAQRLTSLITALGSPFQAGGSIGNTSFGSTNFPTTVDTNSGNKSNSTLRVVLATDQPQLTNKLLVTPDANSSVNLNQVAGNSVTAGAGAVAAGTLRTTLASDDPAVAVLGTTSGSKVITDASGTIQEYLRGLIYLLITPLAALVTIARKFVYNGIVTLTTTNFSGLTSGSGWQSASITTNGSAEIQFLLKTVGAAGSTGVVDFYLAESFASGDFTDSAGTSEGTFTAGNIKNSIYLGALQLNTTNTVVGMLKYRAASNTLSERVVLLAVNNSGGTISSTGANTVFNYQLVN